MYSNRITGLPGVFLLNTGMTSENYQCYTRKFSRRVLLKIDMHDFAVSM